MTLRKYFLGFLLQLAFVSLISGKSHREGNPTGPIVLTEGSQSRKAYITATQPTVEIKIQDELVSNFQCEFKLQLISSKGKSSNSSGPIESIDIRTNDGLNQTLTLGNELTPIYSLSQVSISQTPNTWTNHSSQTRFTFEATIYSCTRGILSWGYIITRSVVVVVFVLIPTLVVYLFFYRRQVALHRAALIREAENARRRNYAIAVIDMSNKYANDHPPTYDDVYDIKEPLPCFCEAVGLDPMPTTPVENPTAEGGQRTNSDVADCPCRRL